ncbi:hypothetical protein PRUPE_8G085600 [Prunus persica]|uniref:Uncharacterized protein n=1 Tax=Prunus persica TaxID=3760 RepID=M5VHF1_PRUPE|nr:hypothetical protein PRUPE_8G085600 [Prunus persica]
MAGGSDSLKESVARIENFFGTMSGDEIECVVTQIEDLNAKMTKIENVFRELKASMERKVTDVLCDMNGLVEAIGGKLNKVEIGLGIVKLSLSGRTSSQEGSMMTKIKVPELKAYVGEWSAKELENFLWDMEPWAQLKLRRHDVKGLNSLIATAEKQMNYRATVTSSEKKKQGGKRHSGNNTVEKRKEIRAASNEAKGEEHKDKKKFSGSFFTEEPTM